MLKYHIEKPRKLLGQTRDTLRHSFATDLRMDGSYIRIVQELLGHKNVSTNMIYTHVLRQKGIRPERSPLER